MSTTPENPGVGPADQEASRPPWSNSVKPCNPQNPGAEEGQTYQEWVAAAAAERVSEFVDKYPYLARLPVTTRNGTTLRADAVEEVVEELYVDPPEEWRDGFAVRHSDRHEVPTWGEAIFWFLTNRQAYDDGVYGHFEAVNGDNFHVRFEDAWTPEYGERQAAKNAGALRQLAGGEYPDEEESARSGESVDGEWGEVATIICGLTASSTPAAFDDLRCEENVPGATGRGDRPLHPDAAIGGRLPPVDHLNTIRDGWSDRARDAARNLMEYHYGLSNDEWAFIRGDEPHPGDGENAAYAHTHPVVVFDIEAADVAADEAVIQRDVHEHVIGAYVDANEYADPEAHDLESVTVKIGDVENPAAYASKYLNLGEEKEMLDADIETVAWAAVTAISGRQRIARSQVLTEAAEADRCLQDPNTVHGENVRRDGRGRVVCAECGSPVGVDADTLTEARSATSQPAVTDGGNVRGRDLSPDDGPTRQIGVAVGVSPTKLEAWRQARRFVESDRRQAEVLSPELVAMEIGMDDPPLEAVEKALRGEELDRSQRPIYGEGKPPEPPTADLLAIEKPSGIREVSNGGGGGASTVEVQLPVDRLWRNTRLRYHGDRGSPPIVCEKDGERVVTDNPRTAAAWLHDHGVDKPWHAEVCLSFRGVEWAPVAESPDGVPDVA